LANRKERYFINGVGIAALLTLLVIVLGAYVRLTDAGLGCPDWPGCYGQWLGVPEEAAEIDAAQKAYPGWQVDVTKAWAEMVHRYFAGGLGLLIFALTVLAFIGYRRRRKAMLLLSGLVVFQALLGMWTVTWLLQPMVVVAHLLGGFAVLATLWWLYLDRWFAPEAPRKLQHKPPPKQPQQKPLPEKSAPKKFSPQKISHGLTLVALLLLVGQITLGGWTSANYAALACADFPLCQGQWLPEANYRQAFQFVGIGDNYEHGVFDNPQRTAIHVFHRLGALGVVAFFVVFLTQVYRRAYRRAYQSAQQNVGERHATLIRRVVLGVAALLSLQVILGISNVVFSLPLAVAVAHNAVAVLLLSSVLLLLRVLKETH